MSDKNNTGFSMRTLLASSIHDMKNILNWAEGSCDQLIADIGIDHKSHPLVSKLKYELLLLDQHMVKLLSLYRLNEGDHSSLNIGQYDVADFIQHCCAKYHDYLSHRHIKLESQADHGWYHYFDNDLLEIVVTNAIANATRYARSAILVSAEKVEDMMCINIEDDGRGFSDEWLDMGAQGLEDPVHGKSGFGLYLTRQVVALHQQKNKPLPYFELTQSDRLKGACLKIFIP